MSRKKLQMNIEDLPDDVVSSHCSLHTANCSLSKIPPFVSRLMPTAQLEHTLQYYGVYLETIDNLYKTVKEMPRLGDTVTVRNPPVYLHYFTGTADYFICEYDGEDTFFGKVRFKAYHPADTGYQKFSLDNLKSNQFLELDLKWLVSSVA